MTKKTPHQKPDSTGHGRPGAESRDQLSYFAGRVMAMESLLIEKGIIQGSDVQRMADELDSRSPADGARVVARAWVDPEFKARLLTDPMTAIRELGYEIAPNMPRLEVVENTEQVHNLIVCTLCSCYPRALLGRPPQWYKSLDFRARAVVDPRGVMKEFGTEVPEDVELRVLDSTADNRFLVLPQRPKGTEGMREEDLAKLVTRDSMIGVTHARSPTASAVL
ncbi:MAG: nitrile hydratase subunit alpha [Dehalococcoidia bacterium]